MDLDPGGFRPDSIKLRSDVRRKSRLKAKVDSSSSQSSNSEPIREQPVRALKEKPKQNLKTPSKIVKTEHPIPGANKAGSSCIGQVSNRKRTFSKISDDGRRESGRAFSRNITLNEDEVVEPEKSFWNSDEVKPKYYLGGFHCKDPIFKELTCNICFYNSFSRGAMKKHIQECHEDEEEVEVNAASPVAENPAEDEDPEVTCDVSENDFGVINQDDDEGSKNAKFIDEKDKENHSDDDGLGSEIANSDFAMEEKEDEVDCQATNENARVLANSDILELADTAAENDWVQENDLVLDRDGAQPVVNNGQDLGAQNDFFAPTVNFDFNNITRNDEEELENDSLPNMVSQNDIDMEERDKEIDTFLELLAHNNSEESAKSVFEVGVHFDYRTDPVTLSSVNTGENDASLDQDHQNHVRRDDAEMDEHVQSLENVTEVRGVVAENEQGYTANNDELNRVEGIQAGEDEEFSNLATLNFINTSETNAAGLNQNHLTHSTNLNYVSEIENNMETAMGLDPNDAFDSLNLSDFAILENDRNFENVDIFEQSYGDLIDGNQVYGEIFDRVDTDNPNCFVERLNSAYETIDRLISQSPSSLDTLEVEDLYFGGNRSSGELVGSGDQEDLQALQVGEDQNNSDVESQNEVDTDNYLSRYQDLEVLDDSDFGENQNDSDVEAENEFVSDGSISGDQDLDDSEFGENQNDPDVESENEAVAEEPLSAEEERARLRALKLILKLNRQTGFYESFRAIDLVANQGEPGDVD